MNSASIYARLSKVDVAQKRAYGVIASEQPDHANEVFDFDSSKPLFMEWSNSISKATDGKSLGNVREMHGKSAVGRVIDIQFDDVNKTIAVEAEIVDSATWEKIEKGVLTGFSIGGRYEKRWADPANPLRKRYTCKPSEVSVVDYPANRDAFFDVIKADGITEQRHFPEADELALEKAIAAPDAPESAAIIESILGEVWKAGGVPAWKALLDTVPKDDLLKIARRKNVDPKEGEDKYGDNADFADPKNKKYPLDSVKHIRAAWAYINMPKNAKKYDAKDLKTIKARIVAAWKSKIDKAGPPSAEKFSESTLQRIIANPAAYPLAKVASELIGAPIVEKGLWAVAQFAGLLEQLAALADGATYETQAEGDGSTLPETMRAALKPIAAAFLQMAEEETDEALHGELNDDAAIEAMASVLGDEAVAKRGRRHSKKTRERYAAMKDHAKAIIGHCEDMEGEDADENDEADKAASAELTKRADVTSELCKMLDTTPEDVLAKFGKLATDYVELRKQVEDWKASAVKTVPSLRAVPVAKEADDANNATKTDENLAKLAGPELTAELMKRALSRPVNIQRTIPNDNA